MSTTPTEVLTNINETRLQDTFRIINGIRYYISDGHSGRSTRFSRLHHGYHGEHQRGLWEYGPVIVTGLTVNSAVAQTVLAPGNVPINPTNPPTAFDPTSAYRHDQTTPANVWNIVHNLNSSPNVSIYTLAGVKIGGLVTHVDANTLTVGFNLPLAGYAIVGD